MRNSSQAQLQEQPLVAEDAVLEESLLDNLVRVADKIRAPQPVGGVVLLAGNAAPARSRPILFIISEKPGQ